MRMRRGRVIDARLAALIVFILPGLLDAAPPLRMHTSYEVRDVAVGAPARRGGGLIKHDRFTVAVIRAKFDQHLYVNGTLMKSLVYRLDRQGREDSRNRHLRGLTRLECPDGKVFESHPPLENDHHTEIRRRGVLPVVPSHLMPLHEVPPELHDLVSLFDIDVDMPDSDQFVSVLVLAHRPQVGVAAGLDSDRKGAHDADETGTFVNLAPSELPSCHLTFLAEDNQTYWGTGILTNYDYESVPTDAAPLALRKQPSCHVGGGSASNHTLIDAIHHMVFRAADYVAVVKETKHRAVSERHARRNTFLDALHAAEDRLTSPFGAAAALAARSNGGDGERGAGTGGGDREDTLPGRRGLGNQTVFGGRGDGRVPLGGGEGALAWEGWWSAVGAPNEGDEYSRATRREGALTAACDAATGLCREAPSELFYHMHPFARHVLLEPPELAGGSGGIRGLTGGDWPGAGEGAGVGGGGLGGTGETTGVGSSFLEFDFDKFDISEKSGMGERVRVQECLAMDQQQRLAEDIASTVTTTFIGALIKAATEPVCAMVIPIVLAIILVIIAIPIALLIIIILEPYLEPLFARMEKGSDSVDPTQMMLRMASPIYWSMWGIKKKRWSRISQILGTGIMQEFMAQGADGGGGWGQLVMLLYGMIVQNLGAMYVNIEYGMSFLVPRFAVQIISLMVPMGIGNFMVGTLASKVVKYTVSAVTHNVVHNSNYALTHSLTQSVTQSVTEAMHRMEKHYYYCLYCYYQSKYCDFCSTYNAYASAGHNLNDLTYYPDSAKDNPTAMGTPST